MGRRDPANGEVLVAIMNDLHDFRVARDQHWYRVPIDSAEKWLKRRWPPQWVAFYQTSVFEDEKHAVNYYARVLDVHEAFRSELFPDEPRTGKGMRRYYQLILGPLERLPQPILSRRLRRIVFIQTTWRKLLKAAEINDLYDESPLEDQLWAALKRLQIRAERQLLVEGPGRSYFLDFAILCAKGNLDVETDGDTWHANVQRAPLDNQRDNDIDTLGWHLLRFNTYQVREQLSEYCIPSIVENITRLGGVEEGGIIPRRIALGGSQQLSLFDEPPKDGS
jgi:very-short-patch-repair endonuclease